MLGGFTLAIAEPDGHPRLEHIPMRSNHLSTVMPALAAKCSQAAQACLRGHPRLSCGTSASKTWMAGTSPAMTPEKWVNMIGTRSSADFAAWTGGAHRHGSPAPSREPA